METSRGALIEKIMFALIPILFSCIVYLINSLSSANERITMLEAKNQTIVTADALHEMNNRLDLAREKLRQDLLTLQTENIERSAENKSSVKVLEWRISALESHQK
jgi:hypothetical protein